MQTEYLTYRNNGTGLEKIIEIDTTAPPPSGFSWAFDPPPPWKFQSLPLGGGGMDIFWNHTSSENQLTELLVAHFAKYRFSFRKLQISQNTDFSFRKLQIFISQNIDFNFAKYKFSFCRLQISQNTDFHFVSFCFANYSKPGDLVIPNPHNFEDS